MKNNLPPKLNSEILKQLATEKLVEMIVEQARAIEQLKSRVIELEQEIEKLKISRERFRQHNIIKATIVRSPQKKREKTRSSNRVQGDTKT
jgi:transposase